MSTMNKKNSRIKRARKSRAKIADSAIHRVSVYKSLQHIYLQLGTANGDKILTTISTNQKKIKNKFKSNNIESSKAIGKLMYALSKLVLLGPVTNIELLKNILSSNSFLRGEYDTNFIIDNKQITQTKRTQSEIQNIVIVATLHRWSKRNLENTSYCR